MKYTRRQMLGSILAGTAVTGGLIKGSTASSVVQLPTWGDSTSSGVQAGPLGLNPAVDPGQVPVTIRIPQADVDAEIERTKIVDGQMLDPSGPWIVAWYEGTGLAGERGNSVMSGHVDYWDVGAAVFRDVAKLPEGAEMNVIGVDGAIYTYALEYIERIEVASLTQDKLNQIVGRTDYAALTLITCGGEFDYDAGAYYERDILRGRLVRTQKPEMSEPQPVEDVPTQEPPVEDRPTVDTLVEEEGGEQVVVTSDANLRGEASTANDPVGVVSAGDLLTVTGATVDAEGYTWLPIMTADGVEGWIVRDLVEPAG